MNKPDLDGALKIGDRVRLIPESLGWTAEQRLRGKTGEVVECRDDGRVTVRFANGLLLMGRDPNGFERSRDVGLRTKK
jgi:hypothetical protein